MKRLVIGILAHVDAGKTTLSESLLYAAGSLQKLGRVDHGDAFLDTDALERQRGITIFSKQALFCWDKVSFTLLDTPGHVDFSPEMERTLQVLDGAVLVISGTDGVQSHTETLWRLLARHHIPTLLFINKMDLPGPGRAALLAGLQARLSGACVDFGLPTEERNEELALCDETILEQVVAGGPVQPATLAAAVMARRVFPCFFGAALRQQGVEPLLNGLSGLLQAPAANPDFSAQIFKISHDEQGNRLTHLKVTGGALSVRTLLSGTDAQGVAWQEKVNQLRVYSGTRFETVERAEQGMVCAVTGLSHTRPGQALGAGHDSAQPMLEPVLSYRVELPPDCPAHTALGWLRQLEEEEPQLQVVWNEEHQEIHLQLMGEIQLEILRALLQERFGLSASFGQGSIVYKETIATAAEGVGHFEPLRHYAEVHLLLEPGEPGSGLVFANACPPDTLDLNWQRLILTHLEEKQHRGVLLGAPLTDVKITLLAGKAHTKHTEGGDFRQATYRAVRQGLKMAQSVLLEPWYAFRLELPQEAVGRALADLPRLCARFDPPETLGETARITGCAPVICLRDYTRELIAYTHGRGHLTCTLAGYEPCHNAQEVLDAAGYDSDRDTADPADSVFCTHGAGFTVKWNQVRNYMHIDTGWGKPQEQAEPEKPQPRRVAAYCATLEQDKELMAIFEHTYGPIKRRRADAMRPVRHDPPPSRAQAAPVPAGPEYLLVDGYNIIFDWEDLSTLARENLDSARVQLINMLCNYQGYCGCHVILVFDAYRVKGGVGNVERVHNIDVVYTREAETADAYIERVTHELGRRHRVRVATSDGAEQMIILGNGALRMSARVFRMEMQQVETAIREVLEQ